MYIGVGDVLVPNYFLLCSVVEFLRENSMGIRYALTVSTVDVEFFCQFVFIVIFVNTVWKFLLFSRKFLTWMYTLLFVNFFLCEHFLFVAHSKNILWALWNVELILTLSHFRVKIAREIPPLAIKAYFTIMHVCWRTLNAYQHNSC